MSYKERFRLGLILLVVNGAATLLLMAVLKRLNLFGFVDMAFFVGVSNLVIGMAVKGGRVFGKERKNLYKRFIPPDPNMTEEEKVEHKIHDIAVGWTFIFSGLFWAGLAGLSYVTLGM